MSVFIETTNRLIWIYLRQGYFNEIVKKLFSNHDYHKTKCKLVKAPRWITLVSFENAKNISIISSGVVQGTSIKLSLKEMKQVQFQSIQWLCFTNFISQ